MLKDLGFHTKTRFFSFKIRIRFFYPDPDWALIPVYGSFKNPDRKHHIKMYTNSAKYVEKRWKKMFFIVNIMLRFLAEVPGYP